MDSFKTLVLVVLVCFAAGSANAQTDTTFFNNAVYVRLNIHELDSVIKSVQTQIQTLENLAAVAGGTADLTALWTAVNANTAKTGITNTQAAAITANTSKLAGIAEGATANATDAHLKNRVNHTGSQIASTISDLDAEVANNVTVAANTAKISYTDAAAVTANTAKTSYTDAAAVDANTAKISYTDAAAVTANTAKLSGIAEGATANSTDAYLLSRTNHTNTQVVATISDFDAEVSNNTNVAANTSNSVPGLGDYLTIDENDNEIEISGANLLVNSGVGQTDAAVNGLGNIIIGYDEATIGDTKTGSHNLVVGPNHNYSSYGGIVVGWDNSITGPYSSVTGGSINVASGESSSVSGGSYNTASFTYSSVSGGNSNTASGEFSSVSGGSNNKAEGIRSYVSGGNQNTASGQNSSVSGGYANTASGNSSSVSGGSYNAANGELSSISGGVGNNTHGSSTSILGGSQNETSATETDMSVIGDYQNSFMGDIASGDELYLVTGELVIVSGCMDSNADNYNSNASIDDGSCYTCTDFDDLQGPTTDDSAHCENNPGNGAISVAITMDINTTSYTINWTGPNGYTNSESNLTSSSYNLTDLDYGTYTATLNDTNNCTSDPVTFEVLPIVCFINN